MASAKLGCPSVEVGKLRALKGWWAHAEAVVACQRTRMTPHLV